MKKVLFILTALIPAIACGQQFPFMEGYNVNPFSLSPAYAGLRNSKILFMDYRSDWTGIDGGPMTYQLSYNGTAGQKKKLGGDFIYNQSDIFGARVGLGARFIYDKTDIFKQILFLGTYSYDVRISRGHYINFALSAGFYKNSVDLGKYFNDPNYVQDLALIDGQVPSRLKFATDVSALYRHDQLEAGIFFSNIMFGTVRYKDFITSYRPLKNYLIHSSYLFKIDKRWSFHPTLILRGGQNIPAQFEASPSFTWNNRFWFNGVYRTGGILGAGVGGEIIQGILLNYSYDLSTNISLKAFGSHQITLGIKIPGTSSNRKS